MEKLAYYTRLRDPWTAEEDSEIIKEYNDYTMDVIQIADVHKRTPGGIAYRLKKLEQIPTQIDARGYKAYQLGDLYREIVTNSKEKRKITQERKNTNIVNKANTNLELEVCELKDEIKSLKSELNEIKVMMKAVYNFEIQTSVKCISKKKNVDDIDNAIATYSQKKGTVVNTMLFRKF